MDLCKQVFVQRTVRFKLHDAQDACSQLEALWESAWELAETTDQHLAQAAQQLSRAQAKRAPKMRVQGRLRQRCGMLETQSQTEVHLSRMGVGFLMPRGRVVLGMSSRAHQITLVPSALVFRTDISQPCGFIGTKARAPHGDVCPVIAKGLECLRSLPEFGSNDNSAACGSPSTSHDGKNSIAACAPSR